MESRNASRTLTSVNSELKKYEPLNSKWVFDSLLGQGASGSVYKLVDTSSTPPKYTAGKHIFIDRKTSAGDSASMWSAKLESVINELTIASKLSSCNNIVKYIDHFIFEREDHSGLDIIIQTELLIPLSSHIAENTISEQDVIKIGLDICSALESMDREGILHRDIKPSNIFLDKDGSYKLGDFSISAYQDNLQGIFHSAGTPDYIAPEVYRKNSYDKRADIYSLGILMYRYLNDNRLSFADSAQNNSNQDAFTMRMNGVSLKKPIHASAELAEIILKCCAFHPEDRYENAAELKEALLHNKCPDQTKKICLAEEITAFSRPPFTIANTVPPFDIFSGSGSTTDPFIQRIPSLKKKPVSQKKKLFGRKNKKASASNGRWGRLAPPLVNWFCFTCMLSLMPLIIFLLCRGAFAPEYPWKIKLVIELLYFGLSLAVITIRELVNQKMWNKGQTPYLLALFIMLFILILSAVFFGIMTINDMSLLSISIQENTLLFAAIVISGVSLIVSTCIQIWKEW